MSKKEYISKNYALYLVNYFGNMQTWSKEDVVSEIKRKIVEADVELPAVDVSPVRHEHWILLRESEITGFDPEFAGRNPIGGYQCSNCKKEAILDCNDEFVLSSYCPNCGAKMDKEG